jgi:hypothetical protein
MTMKGKTRIWIGMALLFISGIAVGFFGSGLIIKRHVREFVDRGPAFVNARIVDRLLEDMDITDDQRTEIDSIVERTTPRMKRLATEFGDSMEALVTSQLDSIKTVLGDEKAAVFEKRIEENRERTRRGRGGPRRGHRPDGRVHDPDDIPGG